MTKKVSFSNGLFAINLQLILIKIHLYPCDILKTHLIRFQCFASVIFVPTFPVAMYITCSMF